MAQLVFILVAGSAPAAAGALLLGGAEPAPLGLSGAAYLAGTAFAIGLMRRGYPHGSLGFANLVTIMRMALVAALLAPLLGTAATWALVPIATLVLLLDGADGWLARREGRVSAFGARLDVEVDSALALILAVNIWAAGIVGPLVLLIGLPRYFFVAAARLFPWLSRALPESFGRKLVCVVQVAALIALNAPVLPGWLVLPVVGVVAVALAWSFGRDILWLWRNRL